MTLCSPQPRIDDPLHPACRRLPEDWARGGEGGDGLVVGERGGGGWGQRAGVGFFQVAQALAIHRRPVGEEDYETDQDRIDDQQDRDDAAQVLKDGKGGKG